MRIGCSRREFTLAAILASTLATGTFAQVTFDGTISTGTGQEWGNPKASALQDNYTGYGDQHLTPGFFAGSELDELYVHTDGTWLYVGVTGNLEQNGNSIVLLIDTDGSGQNVLATEIAPRPDEMPCSSNGPPVAVQGLGQALIHSNLADYLTDVTSRDPASTGTQLDGGFAPNYAIALDTNGGQTYVTQCHLFAAAQGTWDDPSTGLSGCAPNPSPNEPSNEALDYFATRAYRGSGAVNSHNGALAGGTNPNNSQYAFNNTNKLGITGEAASPPPAPGSGLTGDPRSATSGMEAKINLADLGYTVPVSGSLSLKLSVLLTSADGFVSNQTLPPIGAGTSIANLSWRPDFTAVSGDQFAAVSRTVGAFSGTVDGENIVTDFGLPDLAASQDTVTSFGDRDCLTSTAGSELDELYMRTDGYNLYVAVTGNLEGNANAQILLLDVDPSGGQNTLATEIAPVLTEMPCSGNGPPGAVQGLGQGLVHSNPADPLTDTTSRDPLAGGTVLDAEFAPDYAFAVDTSGGNVHVSEYALASNSLGIWDDPSTGEPGCAAPNEALPFFATRVYRGSIPVGAISVGPSSLADGTNPNGSEFAYNNGGTGGVTGSNVAAPGSGLTGDPRTQARGLEAKISLLDLGFTVGQLPVASLNVKAMVALTASDGWVSNQTLPGVAQPSPYADIGQRPSFATIAGVQFVTADLTAASFAPTIDGQDLVNKYGTSNVFASQDTPTTFGDVTLVPVTDCDQTYSAGSEIDQLLAQDVEAPTPALEVALTGNLQGNGNNLVIFLDTIPDSGVTSLPQAPDPPPAGRLSGMGGVGLPLIPSTVTPMAADYAIVANIFGGTAYVDMVNLVANTSTYMGSTPVNTGTGTLTGGAGTDWQFVIGNTNILGVDGTAANDPQTGNAATATTGVELSVPLAEIGSPTNGDQVNIFAIITNSDAAWLSNQLLPAGLGGNFANYDNTVPDFGAIGYESMSFILGPSGPVCNHPRVDINGDGFVDMVDYADFQRCWTGPLSAGNILPGCECFDWNFAQSDGKINVEDFAVFQACAKGPQVPVVSTCDTVP